MAGTRNLLKKLAFLGTLFLLSPELRAEAVLSLGSDGKYVHTGPFARDDMPQTVWITGFSASSEFSGLSIEATYTTTNAEGKTVKETLIPARSTQTYGNDGRITGFYVLLTADDWRNVPEKTATLSFTCTVSGRYDAANPDNNKFTLGNAKGRDRYPEKVPRGASESVPYCISPDSPGTARCDSFGDDFHGVFYLCADLDAGRRYMFGIKDADYPVTMHLKGSTNDLFAVAASYTNVWTDCTDARVIEPQVSGTYFFEVRSGEGQFRFKYAAMPDRLPEKHPHGTVSAERPVTNAVPGYLNDPESGCFDQVIDQCLYALDGCSVGGTYVFWTEGADTNLLMRIYDECGNVLAENRRAAADGFDVRIAWTVKGAKASATSATSCGGTTSCGGVPSSSCASTGGCPLYVGVCQDLAEGETPAAGPVALFVKRVEMVEEVSILTAVPDSVDRSPVDCPTAEATKLRSLGPDEWSNVFALPVRAGITYRVKAKLADDPLEPGEDHGHVLTAKAYTLSGTKKKALSSELKDAAQVDPNAEGWLKIEPNANATVYLEVSVAAEGRGAVAGLDYGPYALYATADVGDDFGILRAEMGGAPDSDMGWKLVAGPAVAGVVAKKEPYYPAGSTVVVPVGGPYAVAAKPISGYKGVNSKGYDANVYVRDGSSITDAREFRYFDKADPLDDGPDKKAKEPTTRKAYAPTKLSLVSGKDKAVSRSLWNDYPGESYRDTDDWYTIAAAEGAYCRISLPWVADGAKTEVRVYGPADWTEECAYNVYTNPASAVRIAAERKGTYYVRVSNPAADGPADCAYRMQALMTTPGTVRFSKKSITVKDTAGYADITVNRTGKDGRIRVQYETVSDTARPGTDFYPQTDELVWEKGDSKAKTVRIKLIPDIVTVPLGVTKSFSVRFWTRTWDDPEVDPDFEYIPLFDSKMGDTVKVSISETKKKSAGTVQAVCAKPKNPSFSVTAGETLEIPFERIGGTNGIVGVVATTAKGTANKSGETDYVSACVTNVWENGVGGPGGASLVIRTLKRPGDYTAKRTFTVKLKALASKKGDAVQYAKPALAAKSVSVTILNDKFARTVSDWAKSKAFPPGVTGVRESKSGTWFCADAFGDELWSANEASSLTFTLSGPGRFTYDAEGAGGTVTNWIRSGSQTLKISGVTHILSWDYVQLPAVTPDVPSVDGAVVAEGVAELRFVPVAGDAEKGIAYRVFALSAGSGMKLGGAGTEVLPDGDGVCRTDVERTFLNKGKYTWRADSFFVGGPVTNRAKKAWSFTVADESKLAPGATLAETKVSGADAYGNGMEISAGGRVVLHRLVKARLAVGAVGSKVAKVSGKLPAGLSLKAEKRPDGLSQYWLAGTPTKAGECVVTFRETAGGVGGTTTALSILVEDSGRPAGSFVGLATPSRDAAGQWPAVGQYRQVHARITFSASSNGKLSAKALIGGKTYSFSDTGYSRVRTNEEGRVTLEARLVQLQKVKNYGRTVTFTNELGLAVLESPADDSSDWTLDEPGVTLLMRALPDLQGDGFRTDVVYSGTLVRDNRSVKPWVSDVKSFSGYYTVALVPDTETGGWTNNVPNGNGYLTVKLDAKGGAKVSGALADGSAFSASLFAAFGEKGDERVVRLPLYVAKGKSVLAGWLGIRFPLGCAPAEPVTGSWTEDVPMAEAFGDEGVVWVNDDSNATFDGKFGYGIEIHPVGGWYDTVINLQRHYIGGDYDHLFEVDTATVDELWQISDLLPITPYLYHLAPSNALPCGQSVDLAVNNLIVDKQSLAKDSTKTYYVWDECVNPANVKLTFKRATGILTGTCDIWYEALNAKGVPVQKRYSKCKHAGVFLMCRGEDDILDDDMVTAGALVIPQTIELLNGAKRKWNANFRFNVRSEKRKNMDWGD